MIKPSDGAVPPTNISGGMGPLGRLKIFWARGVLWDYAGLLLVVLWIAITIHYEKQPLLVGVPAGTRQPVFQTLATVSGTMAGLIFTSISIMVNLVRTPLSALDRLTRPEDKRKVGDVFIAVLPNLVITFGLALIVISVEASLGRGVVWLEALLLTFAFAATSGLARVVWVLRRLLKLSNS